jgi:hypothetical protein
MLRFGTLPLCHMEAKESCFLYHHINSMRASNQMAMEKKPHHNSFVDLFGDPIPAHTQRGGCSPLAKEQRKSGSISNLIRLPIYAPGPAVPSWPANHGGGQGGKTERAKRLKRLTDTFCQPAPL